MDKGDHRVTFAPLVKYIEDYRAFQKEQEQFLEKEILYAFSMADLDGHGFIPEEDLRKMAREVLQLTYKQIDDMIEGTYLDDKGNLNYRMFVDKVLDHDLVFRWHPRPEDNGNPSSLWTDEWTPEYGFR